MMINLIFQDDDKAKGKLYHIANEILTTEKTFVDALKLVCDVSDQFITTSCEPSTLILWSV